MEIEEARERFIHAVNKLHGINLEKKILLDVGCGCGNIVLAAAKANIKKVIGIDNNLSFRGENHFSTLALENNIDLANTELIEGLLGKGKCHFPDDSFDIITLIDVFEHLSQPAHMLNEIVRILKPRGQLIIDFCPLFYSPIGAHLWPFFPRNDMPWVHLYKDFYKKILSSSNVNSFHLSAFLQLNKITSDEFFTLIKCFGLEVIEKHIGRTAESPEFFEKNIKEKIDMALIPNYDDLFIEWIRVICVKKQTCFNQGIPTLISELLSSLQTQKRQLNDCKKN